jgi:plastocyanin
MKYVVLVVLLVCFTSGPVAGTDVYRGVAVRDGGAIEGRIGYAGPLPDPVTYKPTKDVEVCGPGAHTTDEISVNSEGGVRYALVYLTDIEEGAALDRKSAARLDQTGCQFVPHIVTVPRGGTLEIFNNDGILHNVRTSSKKNAPFNKAQPKFMKKIKHRFTSGPEKIKVNCDAHSWMSAWIVVTEHPYYTVTDEHGAFVLPDVPAGTYQIAIWHESFGIRNSEVTVSSGQSVRVDATFAKE